jgi:hypothetical protein
VAIATPFDARMATLAAELDGTRFYYGSAEERQAMDAKVEATTRLNEEASVAALARRGAFNASASGAGNFLGGRELVDDVASGRVDLATVPPATLPPALAALPLEAQSAVIEETANKRRTLQRQIAELAAERDAYIESEIEAAGGAAESLDQQIYEAVRDQAAPLGLSYEGGPKF